MAIQDRNALKKFFSKGQRPTEGNFFDLIDSMYNKLDDDLLPEIENSATGVPAPKSPLFASILNNPGEMAFLENAATAPEKNPLLQFKPGGLVGIGVVAPLYRLHVNGAVAATARVGTYADPTVNPETVLANGKWQKILTGLNGLNAFEIVASASGAKKSGNYALLHATALSTFGNSKSCIVQHSARYKGLWRNIRLKWTGTLNSYNLEIRTTTDFGTGVKIKYNITQLICE